MREPTGKYILHGARGSGAVMVEMAMVHIGIPYDVVEVSLEREEQRGDAYAAINPQRKIPTLITPAGETLTESAAILLTLAERYPDAPLLPPVGSPERAQAVRWLIFIVAELYSLVEINDYPARFAGSPDTVNTVRERVRAIWRERWLIVEKAIAGKPWLLASGLCVSDFAIATVSRWAQQKTWRPDNVPRIEAIAAALADHATVGPLWRHHFG